MLRSANDSIEMYLNGKYLGMTRLCNLDEEFDRLEEELVAPGESLSYYLDSNKVVFFLAQQ